MIVPTSSSPSMPFHGELALPSPSSRRGRISSRDSAVIPNFNGIANKSSLGHSGCTAAIATGNTREWLEGAPAGGSGNARGSFSARKLNFSDKAPHPRVPRLPGEDLRCSQPHFPLLSSPAPRLFAGLIITARRPFRRLNSFCRFTRAWKRKRKRSTSEQRAPREAEVWLARRRYRR